MKGDRGALNGVTSYKVILLHKTHIGGQPLRTSEPLSSFTLCRVFNMNPMKLVNLMGHSSSQMVYQVYWDYVEELEDDVDDIIRYFGKDVLIKPGKKISPLLTFGDSFGSTQRKLLNQ